MCRAYPSQKGDILKASFSSFGCPNNWNALQRGKHQYSIQNYEQTMLAVEGTFN